jgi:hypothetical protein
VNGFLEGFVRRSNLVCLVGKGEDYRKWEGIGGYAARPEEVLRKVLGGGLRYVRTTVRLGPARRAPRVTSPRPARRKTSVPCGRTAVLRRRLKKRRKPVAVIKGRHASFHAVFAVRDDAIGVEPPARRAARV